MLQYFTPFLLKIIILLFEIRKFILFYHQLKNYKNIHIIGNPPFGRQSSLAIKFIKKSCEFCDTLSFILPKSFKKESLKKHFPFDLRYDKKIHYYCSHYFGC